MVLIACRLTSAAPLRQTGRVKYIKAHLQQNGDLFSAVWFNMPYLAPRLKEGDYLFYGRVQNRYGQVTLINPTFEPIEHNRRLKGLVPVYPLKATLTQRIVRESVAQALQRETFQSVIPEELRKKYSCARNAKRRVEGFRAHRLGRIFYVDFCV